MFKTDSGEQIDLEKMRFIDTNGNVYGQYFMSMIYNRYQQMLQAEYLMENFGISDEKEAFFVAGEIRHDMDKYGMTEDAAIENGLDEYISKYREIFSNTKKSGPEEALSDLIEAGDWHIKEDILKSLANKTSEEFMEEHPYGDREYLGSVYYGNYVYDLVGTLYKDNVTLEIERYLPVGFPIGEISKEHYFFDTLNYSELRSDYLTDSPEILLTSIVLNDNCKRNLDDFKKNVAYAMTKCSWITSLFTEEYKDLKDTGMGFPQQWHACLGTLDELRGLRKKCPKRLIGKKELYNIDEVKKYYEDVFDFVYDYEADHKDNCRRLVREMIYDGLTKKSIKTVFNQMNMKKIGYDNSEIEIEAILQEPKMKKEYKKNQNEILSR